MHDPVLETSLLLFGSLLDRRIPDGVESAKARISINADAPFTLELIRGWESPAYGRVEPAPVLELRAQRPIGRIFTDIALPKMGGC